jgi:hypothetical protein
MPSSTSTGEAGEIVGGGVNTFTTYALGSDGILSKILEVIMAEVEERLAALGLILPAPLAPPPWIPAFQLVHLADSRAFISGHVPQNADVEIEGEVEISA